MISIDANLLLFAFCERSPFFQGAQAFLQGLAGNKAVVLSEFVLTEFYLHLRNPAVVENPLSGPAAAEVVQSYRRHPCWGVIGFPPGSRPMHDRLWELAAEPGFARRRIFDARLALSLRGFGVTHWATANEKDFAGFGFERVWNPLEDVKMGRSRGRGAAGTR